MKLFCLPTASVLLAVLLTGCATPQSRIKKNPDLYAALPAAVQESVQAGRIELGFSRDAVFLALGRPHRTYTRTTTQGEVVVWSYVSTDTRYEQQQVSGTFRYRDRDGRLRSARDTVWVDVRNEVEYERVRVEFVDDAVTAIEQTNR